MRHVGVGAAVEAVHARGGVDLDAGEVQDRHPRGPRIGLEPAADLDAADVGQVDVEDDHAGVLGRAAHAVDAARLLPDLEAGAGQRAARGVAVLRAVVDDSTTGSRQRFFPGDDLGTIALEDPEVTSASA
jgi:hypothetical protein